MHCPEKLAVELFAAGDNVGRRPNLKTLLIDKSYMYNVFFYSEYNTEICIMHLLFFTD